MHKSSEVALTHAAPLSPLRNEPHRPQVHPLNLPPWPAPLALRLGVGLGLGSDPDSDSSSDSDSEVEGAAAAFLPFFTGLFSSWAGAEEEAFRLRLGFADAATAAALSSPSSSPSLSPTASREVLFVRNVEKGQDSR